MYTNLTAGVKILILIHASLSGRGCFVTAEKMSMFVGFEVLTAVSTKMAVFWVVAPCSLVEVYQRFRGPFCLQHQGDRPDEGGSLRRMEKIA
jgi:hypothetical protein